MNGSRPGRCQAYGKRDEYGNAVTGRDPGRFSATISCLHRVAPFTSPVCLRWSYTDERTLNISLPTTRAHCGHPKPLNLVGNSPSRTRLFQGSAQYPCGLLVILRTTLAVVIGGK